ncbi:hypothetical protein GCM10011450_25620 [Advenella faeciporci]|uniref:Uncharacterized protein n=1 Tax=Advenella faeciporci TaxID=797535 RepID=A0A918JPS5_9BURK|nr:hypothetical protein [Advenella faeciporci]GGW94665.1 hypothetical protein GCM10011450_25620 [Advenella faeciporci]
MSLVKFKSRLGKLKSRLGKLLFAMGSAPMGVALLLWLPLWFVLDNFLIAGMLAIFISFLLAMSVSLYRLNTEKREEGEQDTGVTTRERGNE